MTDLPKPGKRPGSVVWGSYADMAMFACVLSLSALFVWLMPEASVFRVAFTLPLFLYIPGYLLMDIMDMRPRTPFHPYNIVVSLILSILSLYAASFITKLDGITIPSTMFISTISLMVVSIALRRRNPSRTVGCSRDGLVKAATKLRETGTVLMVVSIALVLAGSWAYVSLRPAEKPTMMYMVSQSSLELSIWHPESKISFSIVGPQQGIIIYYTDVEYNLSMGLVTGWQTASTLVWKQGMCVAQNCTLLDEGNAFSIDVNFGTVIGEKRLWITATDGASGDVMCQLKVVARVNS